MKNGYWQFVILVLIATTFVAGCSGSSDAGQPAEQWQARAKSDPNRGLNGEK